jgi:hypothetical protein
MLTIRLATADDVALIRRMIQELADFEEESDQVLTTEADIARDGFGENPEFRAFIADWHGQAAGFARTLTTTQPGEAPVSTWRICLCGPNSAGGESARRFWRGSRRQRRKKIARSFDGQYSTGISPP